MYVYRWFPDISIQFNCKSFERQDDAHGGEDHLGHDISHQVFAVEFKRRIKYCIRSTVQWNGGKGERSEGELSFGI